MVETFTLRVGGDLRAELALDHARSLARQFQEDRISVRPEGAKAEDGARAAELVTAAMLIEPAMGWAVERFLDRILDALRHDPRMTLTIEGANGAKVTIDAKGPDRATVRAMLGLARAALG